MTGTASPFTELTPETTVGSIVTADIRKANVFKQFGIDYCCGGKKSLADACRATGADYEALTTALGQPQTAGVPAFDFNGWTAAFLADYIYNQHHLYYYRELPVILELMHKVASRHGDGFPPLKKIQKSLHYLVDELNDHFQKEEEILFPYIKAHQGKGGPSTYTGPIISPLDEMEDEHETAGALLHHLKELTNDFTPPEGACNSFKLLYAKLSDLYDDLQVHVHLENNILFPKVRAL